MVRGYPAPDRDARTAPAAKGTVKPGGTTLTPPTTDDQFVYLGLTG